MPRIDRRTRTKTPRVTELWPAPPTQAASIAACHSATIEGLLAAREQLHATAETESTWSRFGLEFAISSELKRRFREQLELGLSALEKANWAEILEDRQFVKWHVARTPTHHGTVVPIGNTEGEQSDEVR